MITATSNGKTVYVAPGEYAGMGYGPLSMLQGYVAAVDAHTGEAPLGVDQQSVPLRCAAPGGMASSVVGLPPGSIQDAVAKGALVFASPNDLALACT